MGSKRKVPSKLKPQLSLNEKYLRIYLLSLRHISYYTVSDYKKYKVLRSILISFSKLCNMVNNRSKVGGTIQLNLSNAFLVSIDNT